MLLFTWHGVWPIVSVVLYAMCMSLAVFASVTMILRRHDPVKTLSWMAVMILLPYVGLVLYLLFGQNYRKKKMYSRKGLADLKIRKRLSKEESKHLEDYINLFNSDLRPFKKIIYQNLRNSYSLLDLNHGIEFFFNGREALDAMYEAIEGATHHVHLQTYILEEDRIGGKFLDLLCQKVRQGVEVRLMYDGVGSLHIRSKLVKRLQSAGVEVLEFSPVRILMPTSKINYRNHRKILVVDSKVGFLGGVNIADRYYYGVNGAEWFDTQVRITGESVASLQASFLLDRYFVINHKLSVSRDYYPQLQKIAREEAGGEGNCFYSQIISSGPDSDWAGIMQCYFTAITSAENHIYIVTPYFTPNETILNAIKVAALGGVDVRLMIPQKGDSHTAHYSTRSYIGELLEAGVKVFLFGPGFNHSKVISVDGRMAIIGSANMDVRSFEHNFEIMTALYNERCAQIIEERFTLDMERCQQIKLGEWRNRSSWEKVKESFFRLLSPLL